MSKKMSSWVIEAPMCVLAGVVALYGCHVLLAVAFVVCAGLLAFAAWHGLLARIPQQTLMLDGVFVCLILFGLSFDGVPWEPLLNAALAVVLMLVLGDVFTWLADRRGRVAAEDVVGRPPLTFRLHLALVALVLALVAVYAAVWGVTGWSWGLLAYAVAMLAVVLGLLFGMKQVTAEAMRETRVGCFMDAVFVFWLGYYVQEDYVALPVVAVVAWALPFVADAARRLFGGERLA